MTIYENLRYKEQVIKDQFKYFLGYELNLENPKTFNEKLQWLKLYYHDPLMTKCADKYLVRDFIKETIGEKYLIPLIGVWDRVEDIDFDKLPNQFVLKVNWGSGQNIIVKDKSLLNIEETKNKLRYWLQPTSNNYFSSYEWCYKNIEPKIICEKYIEQMDGNLFDYKFHCFNGNPIHIGVFLYRNTVNFRSCYYNLNWQKEDYQFGYKKYDNDIIKPNKLCEMINISKIISNHFINIRVDFFEVEDKIYIGELTLYGGSGLDKFMTIEQDYRFGELLELPKEKRMEYDFVDRNTLLNQVSNLEPIVQQYKDLEYHFNCANNSINNLNNNINLKNEYINSLNNENEELKLNLNWFSILSIFGIQLFAISNNSNYIRLTILGIKLTFKINEESINKIAWWIPIRKWRDSFRAKFN